MTMHQKPPRAGIKSKLENIERTLATLVEAESTREEKDHAAVFARWLRTPKDHALKGALVEIENDLSGRKLRKAEDLLTLATRDKESADKAVESDPEDRAKRYAAMTATISYHKARAAFLDVQDRVEVKDVTIADGPSGGVAVPALIAAAISRRATTRNPFRRLCRVEQTAGSDFTFAVDNGDEDAGWAAESTTRSDTATPTLGGPKPVYGEVYAVAKITEWALEDIFFDAEAWLTNSISAKFASKEAAAFVSGTASAQPHGILHTAPSTIADGASPARSVSALQYFDLASSPAALAADDLIDLSNSVDEAYLDEPNAVAWVMRRATLAQIRKLKSTTGAPLLIEGAGPRPLLLGWPVELTSAMPASGGGDFPIAFGNWRGYGIADRGAMKIDPDTLTAPGFIRFYVRRRVGGIVIDNQAIKLLKF